MPDERTELKYLIALTMVPAIGPVTARKLIDEIGSARRYCKQEEKPWKASRESGHICPDPSMNHPCLARPRWSWNSWTSTILRRFIIKILISHSY